MKILNYGSKNYSTKISFVRFFCCLFYHKKKLFNFNFEFRFDSPPYAKSALKTVRGRVKIWKIV